MVQKMIRRPRWKIIRPLPSYEEWRWSGGCVPIHEDLIRDRRLSSGAFVLYALMVGRDWYDRTVLRLPICTPMSILFLMEARGWTRQTAYRQINCLVAAGWAEKIAPGQWRPLKVAPVDYDVAV